MRETLSLEFIEDKLILKLIRSFIESCEYFFFIIILILMFEFVFLLPEK